MKEYELGKFYALGFVEVIVKNDFQYIVVSDGDQKYTIKPYDYQTEYSLYPRIISCYVRKVGLNGFPYFEQAKENILVDRYSNQFGNVHSFCIDEILIDSKTQSTFYQMSDEYGILHRYYPGRDEAPKRRGESIDLIVKGIVPAQTQKNNARLELVSPDTTAKTVAVATRPTYPRNAGKKYFGCEDAKKEFKSSIVFPAGETTPDIDKQLDIICRTIAGFMNADGGTLYIGVSDNGYICGIESDYSHLNDGDDDFTYKENDDNYLQKITNSICKVLGRIAGTLVDMKIEEADGMKYCVIDIKKAPRPIWFYGSKIFVRIVTTNRKLSGDEITQFILDRVSKNSFAKQRDSEDPVEDKSAPDAQSDSVQTPAIPQPAPILVAPVAHQAKKSKSWRCITFYKNGEWSLQQDEITGDDVVCTVGIPSDAKKFNHILILAYEDGHVEAVTLKTLLYGKSGLLPGGTRRGRGLCLSNGKLVAAFCANKKDMLLLTSEVGGERFVKALDVDTLGIHDKIGQGNKIIRENGASLIGAVRIPNDDGARISLKGSGIFIEKNQKYYKGGVKYHTLESAHRKLIDDLTSADAAA